MSGISSSQSTSVGNPVDSNDVQNIQELAIAVQLLWSTVSKIKAKIGALAILTKLAEIDGEDCFIIVLPQSRWQLVDGEPVPRELT